MMTDEQMMALAQTYQTPMHIFDMAILKKRVAFLKVICLSRFHCVMQ